MICTEYMARTNNSTFQTIMPMLKEENIGAINWGLVSGKTNTIFAWSTPLPDVSAEIERQSRFYNCLFYGNHHRRISLRSDCAGVLMTRMTRIFVDMYYKNVGKYRTSPIMFRASGYIRKEGKIMRSAKE
jgi:hypothetical protein